MTTNNKPAALNTQVGGNHCSKYAIQPVEFIQANHLDFAQGNIVKLATRFRDKGGAQDLRKIKHYADILLGLEYGEDATPAPVAVPSRPDGIYTTCWIHPKAVKPWSTRTELTRQEKAQCVGIGVQRNGVSFLVALDEHDDVELLPDDKEASERASYLDRECDALHDFDSAEGTRRLVEDNPALADMLGEGWSIPALGVLVEICYLHNEINQALEAVAAHAVAAVRR